VAARLGHVELAERYFREAAAIDLDDTMGNAAGGVHIAALGSLWQAAVLGFAGLTLRPDGLGFDPHLPPAWRSLGFSVEWRGRLVRVRLEHDTSTLAATLERGNPMIVGVNEQLHRLRRGETWVGDWGAA
jgi:kojibiose phosphorylase